MDAAPEETASWVERAQRASEADPRIEAYEVRLEVTEDRRTILRDGSLHGDTVGHVAGLGLRAHHGAGSGYAFTNELSSGAVEDLVDRAGRLAEASARSPWTRFEAELGAGARTRYEPEVRGDPHHAEQAEVRALLERVGGGIQEITPSARVQVGFASRSDRTVLATSAGTWLETRVLTTSLLGQCAVRDGARRGEASDLVGGERGLGDYPEPEDLGREVGRQANESLEAVSIPSGRYRTLCDNRLTGILVHESFGHLTEYDLVAPGWSVLQDRLGERLAREDVTIRDAPVVEADRRTGVAVPYDHEGVAGRTTTLLDQGQLAGYLHSRDSAAASGVEATGSGRAFNVHHPPIVRMRNTYMEGGDLRFEEALEALGDGVYLKSGLGGAPRPDGSFTFTAQRGYRVEAGELKEPIRMATINGNVLDFLQNIEGLTREVEVFTNAFGGCGKWGQSFLHVGFGGPHVLVPEALVGGQGG